MMQFIIEQTNLKKYFCNKNKVIVFDSEQDAYNFAQAFYNYAIMEGMYYIFSDPDIMRLVTASANQWKVIEKPEDFKVDTINYNEFKK